VFLKPTSSYLENGGTIEIPHPLDSLHHEVELAVVIGQKARDVPERLAMNYIGGYALALDMTARELQVSAMVENHLSLLSMDLYGFVHIHSSH
jgi:acylpyruvate hydrolase